VFYAQLLVRQHHPDWLTRQHTSYYYYYYYTTPKILSIFLSNRPIFKTGRETLYLETDRQSETDIHKETDSYHECDSV